MYEKNKTYKFEILNRIFYTGKIIEEDESFIKIKSIKGEELILNKKSIVQSKLVTQRIGDENNKKSIQHKTK